MALPKFAMSENLQKRMISAGILAPIVLLVVWFGGIIFSLLVVLMAVLMSFEWSGIIAHKKDELGEEGTRRWRNYGVAYVTVFAVSLLYIRHADAGFGITLLMLLVVWATDIAAYFTGRAIGGPKILPVVSPNKTWAGLGGGMLVAAVVSAIASIFIDSMGAGSMLFAGAALAVVSQAGDFFESWVKRQFGVKDSGDTIPGHGGLMDRLDGLVPVAPIFALVVLFKGGAGF